MMGVAVTVAWEGASLWWCSFAGYSSAVGSGVAKRELGKKTVSQLNLSHDLMIIQSDVSNIYSHINLDSIYCLNYLLQRTGINWCILDPC